MTDPTPAGPLARSTLARGTASLVCNGASTASNALVLIMLARNNDARSFGGLAVSLTVLPLAVAFLRGWVIEPLVSMNTQSLRAGRRQTVLLSAGTSAAVLTIGSLSIEGHQLVVAGLAVGAGASVAMERERWGALGGHNLGLVTIGDVGWVVIQAAAVVLATRSSIAATWAWAGGGAFALTCASLAVRRDRTPPVPGGLRRTARPRWGFDYLVAAANAQTIALLVPFVINREATGALRAATVLLGATTIISTAIQPAALRYISTSTPSEDSGRRVTRLVTLLAGGAAALATVPILLLPERLGTGLLGPTWHEARAILPILVAHRVVVSATLGPMIRVRVLDASENLVRDRLLLGVTSIVLALTAGHFAGVAGVAWAMLGMGLVTFARWSSLAGRSG